MGAPCRRVQTAAHQCGQYAQCHPFTQRDGQTVLQLIWEAWIEATCSVRRGKIQSDDWREQFGRASDKIGLIFARRPQRLGSPHSRAGYPARLKRRISSHKRETLRFQTSRGHVT